jgi:hypothetical protein
MPEAAVGGGQRLAAVAQLIFLMRRPYRAVQLKGWQRLVCSRTVGFRSQNKTNRLGGLLAHNYYAVQVFLWLPSGGSPASKVTRYPYSCPEMPMVFLPSEKRIGRTCNPGHVPGHITQDMCPGLPMAGHFFYVT